MKIPGCKDVRLPAGAIPSNWPLLTGVVLSVVVLVGLLLTGEEVPEQVDPLDVGPADIGEVEAGGPAAAAGRRRPDRLGRGADARAPSRGGAAAPAGDRAHPARGERGGAGESGPVGAGRGADWRGLRERQAQPAAPEQPEAPLELLARTADEADLLETLRLENIAREAEALRAPMVVSSARGIGERQHALRSVAGARPGAGATALPASAGGLQPGLGPAGPAGPVSGAADPAVLGPQAFGQAPRRRSGRAGRGRTGRSTTIRPAAGMGDQRFPQRAAAGSPGGGQAGRFSVGPRADGGTGGAGPAGVVVTPNDGRDHRLYEGTMLPAVLQTQLDGTFSGPLSAQVTRHVYSADRQRVLVPRGTIALGASQGVQDLWQGRLAIGFHRLIFPDGRWVRMEFAGMNGLGETSLRDQVDRHYVQMFAAAGGVGLLAGFAQAGGQGQFRSAVSEQMANASLQIVSQFLNRLPEVTIRAGHRVNIRLMEDLVVPAEAAWDVD